MKLLSIITGMCAVLLVAAIFTAGCTSSPGTTATDTVAAPQVTPTIATAPVESDTLPQLTGTTVQAQVADQGTQPDSDGPTGTDTAAASIDSAGSDAATASADAAIDPFNSTSQPVTMVPDSADIGDPIP
jgi:hypothetical protein